MTLGPFYSVSDVVDGYHCVRENRCANTWKLIRPKRDDSLWQRRQKQDNTNTKKDDVFVQEFPGKVPRYWVGGYTPFDDTGCREEKRPRNRKRTNSHQ